MPMAGILENLDECVGRSLPTGPVWRICFATFLGILLAASSSVCCAQGIPERPSAVSADLGHNQARTASATSGTSRNDPDSWSDRTSCANNRNTCSDQSEWIDSPLPPLNPCQTDAKPTEAPPRRRNGDRESTDPQPIPTFSAGPLSDGRKIPFAEPITQRIESIARDVLPPDPRTFDARIVQPTMIYRSSEVVLCVPAFPGRTYQFVTLRKISGLGMGEISTAQVHKGVSVLRSLTTGAYDVWYGSLSQSQTLNTPPDRRILVELDDPEVSQALVAASHSGPAQPTTPLAATLQPSTLENRDAAQAIDRGQDLLRRGASFSAHREFLKAIAAFETEIDSGNEPGIEEEIRTLLCRAAVLDLSTPDGCANAQSTAQALANMLADHPQAASAVAGLGSAYMAMANEPSPLILNGQVRAACCWIAASKIDPTQTPWNDLGVCYHQNGWVQKAADCFRREVSRTTSPAPHYNLGRCLESFGQTHDAIIEYERAVAIDPRFVPAIMDLSRLRTSPDAPAMYPEDLHRLVVCLNELVRLCGPQSEPGLWALRAIAELAEIPREEKCNRTSLPVRRLIPNEHNTSAHSIESASRESGSGFATMSAIDGRPNAPAVAPVSYSQQAAANKPTRIPRARPASRPSRSVDRSPGGTSSTRAISGGGASSADNSDPRQKN